jgi:hypothetical protein
MIVGTRWIVNGCNPVNRQPYSQRSLFGAFRGRPLQHLKCLAIAGAFGSHRVPQPSHFGVIASLGGQYREVTPIPPRQAALSRTEAAPDRASRDERYLTL